MLFRFGAMPPPPFQLVDNEHTWLDFTDLVFIDPVGTGYSRAAKPELANKYFGLQGDIQSVGEFIRLYLARNERWTSPLFLVGESYGTTRASGLSGYLIERGRIRARSGNSISRASRTRSAHRNGRTPR